MILYPSSTWIVAILKTVKPPSFTVNHFVPVEFASRYTTIFYKEKLRRTAFKFKYSMSVKYIKGGMSMTKTQRGEVCLYSFGGHVPSHFVIM